MQLHFSLEHPTRHSVARVFEVLPQNEPSSPHVRCAIYSGNKIYREIPRFFLNFHLALRRFGTQVSSLPPRVQVQK